MASIASKELAANNPGLHTSPYETNKGYLVLQTMFQIKDPKISLDFYPRILGIGCKFTLYFMSYEDVSLDSSDPVDRTVNHHSSALHNWDTESDQEGFWDFLGHIGITLDDTIKACERFQRLGVEFSKKQLLLLFMPSLSISFVRYAFIKDPNGYWTEICDMTTIG
ncbi:hypothetical protein ES332_A03G042800v1 [Gossypium tomentosum]|uniref:Lactoylglutathione lyase n=1 Tax=Gossypium tomentosum TaxID=34277 RepID=A0A5D2R2P9_GOSTO|nr:hypothetical protein ES332_A03G042800v1 [Gossypium tomentosum]